MIGRIGFGFLGFVYAIAAYQIPTLSVAWVIATIGTVELIKASVLIQFGAGALLSIVAYCLVSRRSLKYGMRACYGLVGATLFIMGGYTIIASL